MNNSIYFSKKNKSNDTLRDLFSRLKEASKIKKDKILVPYSKINGLVLLKFYKKGLIASFVFDAALNGFYVSIKYTTTGLGILDSLLWISSISRRIFFKNKFLFKIDKKCLYLFSNEKGLFFSDELSETMSGGEVLCKILY